MTWQPPTGGVSKDIAERFHLRTDKLSKPGHWLWTGTFNNGYPFMWWADRSGGVNATRVAWALAHPGEEVPRRLDRKPSCPIKTCVNPECREPHKNRPSFNPKRALAPHSAVVGTGKPVRAESNGKSATPPKEEPRTTGHIGGVSTAPYRTLEALGQIQFGIEPPPRPLFRRKASAQETLETPEGPVVVERPKALQQYDPTPGDFREAETLQVTAEELLELIFSPDTVVMTFKTGHVWISTPKARIDAPDGRSAILGVMIMSGKHKVRR